MAEDIKLEFLIGSPSKSTIDAKFDDYLNSWIGNNPVGRTKAISNRVDWNRNIIWNQAKEYDTSLIMIDTDVYPVTPYNDVKRYLYEDFANEYDVVFAPLLSHSGNLLFQAYNMEDYKKDKPYDAVYSGFGFTAFSKRLVRTLKPLTHLDIIDESMEILELPKEFKEKIKSEITDEKKGEIPPIVYHSLSVALPEYFTYSPQLSEDTQFCRRMRELKIKMAIDPRILCNHMTEVPFKFNLEQIKVAVDEKLKQKKE